MKAKLYRKLFSLFIISIISIMQVFPNTRINEMFANQNFSISQQNNIISIFMEKNPWESFTFSVSSMDIMENPVVNLDIKTNEPIELRVDLTDGIFVSSKSGIIKKEINQVKNFTRVSFDFTEMIDGIDLTGDVYLIFYVNPGCEYKGEIDIRNFSLNADVSQQADEMTTNGFRMYPSPASTYTQVEIPEGGFTKLDIIDMNGREVKTGDISSFSGATFRVGLDELPKGYYTVRLSGDDIRLTEKLIIN